MAGCALPAARLPIPATWIQGNASVSPIVMSGNAGRTDADAPVHLDAARGSYARTDVARCDARRTLAGETPAPVWISASMGAPVSTFPRSRNTASSAARAAAPMTTVRASPQDASVVSGARVSSNALRLTNAPAKWSVEISWVRQGSVTREATEAAICGETADGPCPAVFRRSYFTDLPGLLALCYGPYEGPHVSLVRPSCPSPRGFQGLGESIWE